MNLITILGLVAGTLTTIAFLPQLIKTWKSKSAKDVSIEMLIVFSLGVFLWLIYGIYLQALPIILANLLTFLLENIGGGEATPQFFRIFQPDNFRA